MIQMNIITKNGLSFVDYDIDSLSPKGKILQNEVITELFSLCSNE